MKKRIISTVLASMLMVMSSVTAFATPNSELQARQQKFIEMQNKVAEINTKIEELNLSIDPLLEKIDNNKQEMKNIEQQIENANIEIENAKVDIEKQEEILNVRIRELYKSGGTSNYLMILFSSDSITDLFSKLDAANRIVKMDKKVVKDLEDKQEQLNENIKSLETKSAEIAKINQENEKTLSEFQVKADEQKALATQAKAEQDAFEKEFLVEVERQLVQSDINLINSNPGNIDQLNGAISRLRSIRDKQLKSSIVKEEVNNAIENGKEQVGKLQIQNRPQNTPNRGQGTVSGSASGNAIVNYAYQFLGLPYIYGGSTPAGFDCSGFTSYVYRHAAGVEIGRTTWTQAKSGRRVAYSEMQPGDLVFTSNYGHVGIYVGNGQFVHSPRTGDVVKVSNIYSFVEARRILN